MSGIAIGPTNLVYQANKEIERDERWRLDPRIQARASIFFQRALDKVHELQAGNLSPAKLLLETKRIAQVLKTATFHHEFGMEPDELWALADQKVSAAAAQILQPFIPTPEPQVRRSSSMTPLKMGDSSLGDQWRVAVQASAAASPVKKQKFCQRPQYSEALRAYKKVDYLWELPIVIGGKLEENFDGGVFFNGCASRISYVLNQLGYNIPAMAGQTVSGRDGKQYIYRLKTLVPFLKDLLGPPDCEWRQGMLSKKSNPELCNSGDSKGIIVQKFSSPTPTATGHAFVGSLNELTVILDDDDAVFWLLPGGEPTQKEAEIHPESYYSVFQYL